MTTAYLNGAFMPLEEARISPMDRGFLFGDGIYEVIPTYGGQIVGFERHIERLHAGLTAIGMAMPLGVPAWRELFHDLIHYDGAGDLAIYLQVTRGVASKRAHRFPDQVEQTVFAYTFDIPPANNGDPNKVNGLHVATGQDRRWQRCHIKSVALLGNVLHMMEGVDTGADEILLFNAQDELTEAAACNVFVVTDGRVRTPALDTQKLPGITRNMLIDMMRDEGGWELDECVVSRAEVLNAQEIWLTSSTKEVMPVIAIDDLPVGSGRAGPYWQRAQALFAQQRFKY